VIVETGAVAPGGATLIGLMRLNERRHGPGVWVLPRVGPPRAASARWRLHLVKHRSSLEHRVHSQLIAFGHRCPVSDLFGRQGRDLLERLECPEPSRGGVLARGRLDRAVKGLIALAILALLDALGQVEVDSVRAYVSGSRGDEERRVPGPEHHAQALHAAPTPQGTINSTDLDSRLVKGSADGCRATTAQAATNDQQIVVAAEVMVASPDFGHLEPMLSAAQTELHTAEVTLGSLRVLAPNADEDDELRIGNALLVFDVGETSRS
jgi:hypothetical protein